MIAPTVCWELIGRAAGVHEAAVLQSLGGRDASQGNCLPEPEPCGRASPLDIPAIDAPGELAFDIIV